MAQAMAAAGHSYDYLLGMPLWSLTLERVQQLKVGRQDACTSAECDAPCQAGGEELLARICARCHMGRVLEPAHLRPAALCLSLHHPLQPVAAHAAWPQSEAAAQRAVVERLLS